MNLPARISSLSLILLQTLLLTLLGMHTAWAKLDTTETPLEIINKNISTDSAQLNAAPQAFQPQQNAQAKQNFQVQSNQGSISAPKFVTVDQAFAFDFKQNQDQENQTSLVKLHWQVKDGYYLYQEKFEVKANNAQIGEIKIQDGMPHQDEFFGEVHIYTESASIEVPIQSTQDGAELIVSYQGCAKSGFCYPPEKRVIPLTSVAANTSADTAQTNQAASTQTQSNQPTSNKPENNQSIPSNLDAPQERSQDASFASQLSDNWWTPFVFLALGIGLAFTPCVLPMYPILTGIVLGGGRTSAAQAFKLSFIYVQGMALTYTLLGLVVASFGVQFQAALQSPSVLIVLSLVFVLLALSMFGAYQLQLPASIQTKLSEWSNKQQGGNLVGVFVMGAISGLVCSPCTTAPLSGALLYVAQTGDLLTGAIALYALAIGMGIPLILVAVFGNKLLPQAGNWMNIVKVGFGFVLLAAPIFLLERILPSAVSLGLWTALGLIGFGWLFHVQNTQMQKTWRQSLVAIIALLGLFYSMQIGISLVRGADSHASQSKTASQISFTRIKTVADLDKALADAKTAGKPVMLDFYADWCVACKEFEKYTFHTPEVEAVLKDFVLIQADVTQGDDLDTELMSRMKVLGLPTLEFWNGQGEHLPHARIAGFMPADTFLQHIAQNL